MKWLLNMGGPLKHYLNNMLWVLYSCVKRCLCQCKRNQSNWIIERRENIQNLPSNWQIRNAEYIKTLSVPKMTEGDPKNKNVASLIFQILFLQENPDCRPRYYDKKVITIVEGGGPS